MTTTTTELYDALMLALERADALSGHLTDRLYELFEESDKPAELYALSVIAQEVCEKHQQIGDKARALHKVLFPEALTDGGAKRGAR